MLLNVLHLVESERAMIIFFFISAYQMYGENL